jgi:regulator of protease activity HflC (stomatin/prohibitin superfamily)
MFKSLVIGVALLASNAVAKIYYAGVAESSGEFGVWSKCSNFKIPYVESIANIRVKVQQQLQVQAFQAPSVLTMHSLMRVLSMCLLTRIKCVLLFGETGEVLMKFRSIFSE